jgi:hypothetical protein
MPFSTISNLITLKLIKNKMLVNMILGMIASGSVQQHKIALGFTGPTKQFFEILSFQLFRLCVGHSGNDPTQRFSYPCS